MVDDVDLYRCAWLLMKQHGVAQALDFCDEREREFSEKKDVLGVVAWRAIKRAIEELDRKPKPGEPMN